MALGKSNRIVIDLDINEKRELHAALVMDGLTLKEWFTEHMKRYLRERKQLPLFKEERELEVQHR